jgi:hypothetical protein
VFLPVVVTNATLATCVVDTSEIDDNGMTTSDDVQEVPFIRFHKTLATEFSGGFTPRNLRAALMDRERTVVVVNINSLESFLKQVDLHAPLSLGPSAQ